MPCPPARKEKHLNAILKALTRESRRSGKGVHDLRVQLDVFDEQKESDESQTSQTSAHGLDLNSHLDLFYAILHRVADTPQEIPFLSILQHLLRIDPKEAVSDIVWDTAETLVHRATLLESREDATKLLRSPSQSKLCCIHQGGGPRKQSLVPSIQSGPVPPPPPPPLSAVPPPPPPPPLPPPNSTMVRPPPPPPQSSITVTSLHRPLAVPPSAPPNAPSALSSSPSASPSAKLLPQQDTPTPKTKMKTINWNKIPDNRVLGRQNIWSMVARNHQGSPMADLDWSEMEGLFCQQAPPPPTSASPKTFKDSPDVNSRRKEPAEITLLDGKRSLNVSIFLKQFRSSNEDIIQLIKNGEHDDIGAEKLRGLLKILPELDEYEMLRGFDGDKSRLGNAEKFLLQLIDVPNYKLRIESMLLREEFNANMNYLEPSISAMIMAGEDLMRNEALREVLYMVVVAGNFLNSGGYAGNAAGVKLSSLQKLTDIRANKPGMNLIHYVALQAEKKKKELLKFPDDMVTLEDATKTTTEQLQNEINALDSRIKKVHRQIDLPSTEKEIKEQMDNFLKIADQEVAALQKDMEELESVRISLADFFCEDSATFKLEECFKVFHGFCVKFKQAVVENERRKLQEEQAAARRKQREEQLAKKRTLGAQTSNGSESECNLVDSLLSDIQSGFQKGADIKVRRNGTMTSEEDVSITGSPALSRRRLGSFSCDQTVGSGREETYSPDVTPTGSLRRRRSRVPSEEDESSLMDYLRASGHDASRERKSWGSLDRSWARRARGGGRKRPDLLTADFSGERERSTSPSQMPSTPEEDSKPKPWKQKIEAWLSENEKEDKHSDGIRRRARLFQSNRRSLEAESESEGRANTLDTLPEGKLAEGNMQYKRVYSDWRPTIDKTDVVGAMEAIAEAQPQSPIKDKSPWRKSNLNVSNTSEQTELDVRRLRRLEKRTSLDSISEEEKRKEVIRNLGQAPLPEDSLPVYIRCPKDQQEASSNMSVANKFKAGKISPLLARRVFPDINDRSPDEQMLPPFAPRRTKKNDTPIDRVEIDSDNIETPPASRKLVNAETERKPEEPAPCSRLKEALKDEEEPLGDGQFDRFSSTRRTRRYRKPIEEEPAKKESTELIPEKQIMKADKQQVESKPVETPPLDKESRLKKWQDKLKYKGEPEEGPLAVINRSGEELKKLGSLTLPKSYKLKQDEKVSKRKTEIDQNDVAKALTSLNDKIKPKFVIPEIKVKTREHEMNDEGFEETQSLVSESPSQGASSGNYEGDVVDAPKSKDKTTERKPVQRSSSVRSTTPVDKKSIIPKRTASLRRPDLSGTKLSSKIEPSPVQKRILVLANKQHTRPAVLKSDSDIIQTPRAKPETVTIKRTQSTNRPKMNHCPELLKNNVERSSSRSSLRSSRSSLASISTVRNKSLSSDLLKKSTLTKKSDEKKEIKKPFGVTQIKTRTNIPASRSSSSGSSIGVPTTSLRRPKANSVINTSFKENASTVPASRSSSSGSSIAGHVKKPELSFMRPTAASSAKDTIDSTRLRSTLRSIK
ncbi:FH2 domain-containing protein 1 isoform X2 [Cimex lectularius]|uniref:FH2 domain-containing protein n=1 Tax=Cimex lectularius TaxID=79782 RepID=A0A8I6RWJ2_CIMLE|nr:FH2 domain-containing protein 1 isoform X2 [Cimex lectularius]